MWHVFSVANLSLMLSWILVTSSS